MIKKLATRLTLAAAFLTVAAAAAAVPAFREMQKRQSEGQQPTYQLGRPASDELTRIRKTRATAAGMTRQTSDFYLPTPASAQLAKRAAAAKVKLRGAMTDNSLWYSLADKDKPFGIYELSTTADMPEYKLVKRDDRFYVMDAVYTGDKLWISHAVEDPATFQVKSMTYYTFNPVTWELLKEQAGDKSLSLTTSTWSAKDEVAYCTYEGTKFGCLTVEDGMLMGIGTVSDRLVAMAAHDDGTLYGIDSKGNLVTIDKQTGKNLKTIGNTGVASYWRTSACIDSKSGIMYYIDCGQSKSSLYAVDLETAVAAKLYDFANSEQLIGLYVVADDTPATVPAMPENLSAEFPAGALSGNVCFDVPATFYDGSAASGDVNYSVKCGEQTLSGKAEWGKRCSVPMTFTEAGRREFEVSLTNATGSSPAVKTSAWIGPDAPSAPTNAKLTYSNGKFTISWTAPTEGVNGGYIDASQLRYDVVRNTDSVKVATATAATSITDEVAEPENKIVGYTYTITPICGGIAGDAATTSKKSIGFIVPPYYNGFESSAAIAGYTVLDANSDGKKWGYNSSSKCMRIQYNKSKDMDDWVFTPEIKLEANRIYTFSFKTRAHNNSDAERIEAAITTGTKASTVVEKIVPPTDITSNEFVTLSGSFKPATSGRYRLGLHGISDKNSYYLYVTGIEISAGAGTGAPAAVADLEVIPAADGSLSAQINFTTPSTDVGGGVISQLEKVELLRGSDVINTWTSPAVGTKLSFTDTNAPAKNVSYSVIAYNAAGAGAAAQQSAFIGFDAPKKPGDVKAAIGSNTGEAVLTWTAPTEDMQGRALSASDITYSVVRKLGEKIETVASGLTATSYKDQAVNADAEQDFFSYGIIASTSGGSSDAVGTQLIPLGAPYAVPFRESFGNGRINSVWGLDSNNAAAGWLLGQDTSIDEINSEDGDNGLLIMEALTKGSTATIYSGSIAIPAQGNPTLAFAYYEHNSLNTLDVMVAEAGSETGILLKKVTLDPSATPGWKTVLLPLDEYKGKNIQIYFKAEVVNTTVFVLDNIRVENRQDHDLALRSLSIPARVAPGEEFSVTVNYENKGLKPASGYSLLLSLNGKEIATLPGSELAAGQTATMDFRTKILPTDSASNYSYKAEIAYAADLDKGNNASDAYSVKRVVPEYPVPENLKATANVSDVALEWTAPDLTVGTMDALTEGAEDFTPYSSGLAGSEVFDDYVGGWTMIDADGVVPYPITSGGKEVRYPNSGRPTGFIVIDDQYFNLQGWEPHGGKRMFASFASPYAANDDWMISPMLSGKAQTVKFWVRSLTDEYGADTFQVWYSSTDMRLSSFTRVLTENNTPTEWKEYTVELPEGARYFAIRCTSESTFAMFVDDITFTPAHPCDGLQLTGYSLYRDGAAVASLAPASAATTDKGVADGTHKYHVTALYNRGESALSQAAEVTLTAGVDAAGINEMRIIGTRGAIEILNGEGHYVALSDAAGVVRFDGKLTDNSQRIGLERGVYMVRIAGKQFKVIVK